MLPRRVLGGVGAPRNRGRCATVDWLVGYGCATAAYPTHMAPAIARVNVDRRRAVPASKWLGTTRGRAPTRHSSQIAARALLLQPQEVEVVMGDSTLPAAPGSSNSPRDCVHRFRRPSSRRTRFVLTLEVRHHRTRSALLPFSGLAWTEIVEVGSFVPAGKEATVLDKLKKGQVPFANQARGDESKDGKPSPCSRLGRSWLKYACTA